MMLDEKQVLDIAERGKAESWSYPKVFRELKKAGVQSHEVWVENFKSIYKSGSQTCLEPLPEGFHTLKTSNDFNEVDFLEALSRRQNHETTYVKFLSDIAEAGVSSYIVDMEAQTVTYRDQDEKNCYIQNIPDYTE
jgi:uncharacterized protein YbcV (DUF1398 family)